MPNNANTQNNGQSTPAISAQSKTQTANKNNEKKKKKTDWGGRLITAILSIIIGFVLGVGSVFGTVAAIVYSVTTQPVDETVELIDAITGLDITNMLFNDEDGYLSRKYLDQKLKIGDLVSEVSDAVSGLSQESTTLSDIAGISPYVGAQVKNLIDTVNRDLGIPLEYDTLMNSAITGTIKDEGSLVKNLLDNFMNTGLGTLIQSIIGESEMNPILKSICYGRQGIDYTIDQNGELRPIGNNKFLTINDLVTEGGEQALFNLEIAPLVGINAEDNNPLTAVLFKTVDGRKTAVTINDFIKEGETIINNIEIATLFGEGEYSADNPMHAILYKSDNGEKVPVTIGELDENFINNIEVAGILGETEYDAGNPMHAFIYKDEEGTKVPVKLGELDEDFIKDIKLADVMTVDATTHPALLSIIFEEGFVVDKANNTVNGVSHTLDDLSKNNNEIINSIKLADIMGDNVHPALQSILTTTDGEGNTIPTTLYHLTNEEASNELINSIPLKDVMNTDDQMLKSILYDENGTPRTLANLSTPEESAKVIQSIKLADVLGVTNNSHKALIFLAYGSATVDPAKARTLGDIRNAGDSLINDIPLSSIVTPDLNDSIISYVVYGKKDIHFQVENNQAKMLQRFIAVHNNKVYNEYGEALPTDSYTLVLANGTFTENGVTYTLGAGEKQTITLQNGTSANVYYLFTETNEKVMFKESTLKDFAGSTNTLTELTSRLTAKDVFGESVNDNAMLKHLADTPINQLENAVESLTFGQVFEDQIYRKNEKGEYVDLDGNVVPKEKRVLGDIWHYMLTNEKGESAEFEYTIVNDMDKLMDNMKREVHNATLNRLAHDGIIQFNGNTLNCDIVSKIVTQPIYFQDPVSGAYNKSVEEMFKKQDGTPKEKVGEMTVEEIIIYVDGIIYALEKING